MKRLFFFGLLFGISFAGATQCIPDTNCIDVDQPGQICPDSLPGGIVGEEYSQPITFIAPDSAIIGTAAIKILKIELDTIKNLPPGITYSCDTNVFFPDTMYCVLLSGTPTDTGTYYLDISVIPYVYSASLGPVALGAQHDSTSLFISISSPSVIPERKLNDFSLIPGFPNPFYEVTKIGFMTQTPGIAELVIYNLLGKQVYHERMTGSTGDNYFIFSGKDLPPGIFPYTITKNKARISGKLIKLR